MMKKMLRLRVPTIIMVLLMLSTVWMIGCSKTDVDGSDGTDSPQNTAASTEETQTTTEVTTENEEPITLKLFNMDEQTKNTVVCKTLEEKFNIILESREVKQDAFMEQYQTWIASDNIPDIFTWLNFQTYTKYVEQGVFAELPLHLVREYAPRVVEWQERYLGQDPFVYHIRDGKNYALPMLWTLGSNMMVCAIREDWLNNVGITKIPETLDELSDAFELFVTGDPDQNGADDTYAISGYVDVTFGCFTYVFGAYDVYPGIFTDSDGTIVRGEVEPGAKKALAVLHEWYEKGYIDPEFVVNNYNNVLEKWYANKLGFHNFAWWELSPAEAYFNGSWYEPLIERNPGAKLTTMLYPKGPEGYAGGSQINPVRDAGVNFGIHLENEPDKLRKYLEVMDAGAFDFDIMEYAFYGEEGVTFKFDENGNYEWIPPYDTEESRLEYGVGVVENNRQCDIGLHFQDYDTRIQFLSKKQYWPYVESVMAMGIGKYDILEPLDKPVFSDRISALNQYTLENYVQFIDGERPLDEIDDFVAEWLAMGGSDVLEEGQQKFDESMK